MTEISMDAEDNADEKLTLATRVPAGVRPVWPDSLRAILTGRVARSAVPARRYWLRFLDAPLAGEIRAAGALGFDELVDAVPRILRCDEGQVDRETIEEWWEYAKRRRWLEEVGSLWALTERARKELQEKQERVKSPDPKHLASGLARWVIPTSLVAFAGLASGRYLVLESAILVMAGVIIVGLLLAAATSRATDPPTDRWLARGACDWLEGRRIWPALGTNRDQVDFTRLYDLDDQRRTYGAPEPSCAGAELNSDRSAIESKFGERCF
jgi:hypothetical protein